MKDHVSDPVANNFHFGDCMTVVYRMKQTSYKNDAAETDKKYSTAGNRG